MRDKGLVYDAIKFLKTGLDGGRWRRVAATEDAIRRVVDVADEALSMAEQPDTPLDAGLSPQPGLVYVSDHSTSRPAQADWLTHAKNPNHVSLLDLRVLEAHLATALGNVKAALNAQTGGY